MMAVCKVVSNDQTGLCLRFLEKLSHNFDMSQVMSQTLFVRKFGSPVMFSVPGVREGGLDTY